MSNTVKYIQAYRHNLYSPAVIECPFHSGKNTFVSDSFKGIEVRSQCPCAVDARYGNDLKTAFTVMVRKND
jgi:hypothetical protein